MSNSSDLGCRCGEPGIYAALNREAKPKTHNRESRLPAPRLCLPGIISGDFDTTMAFAAAPSRMILSNPAARYDRVLYAVTPRGSGRPRGAVGYSSMAEVLSGSALAMAGSLATKRTEHFARSSSSAGT